MKIKRMPFSKWSVLGILAGRKTQTRRLMKPQPPEESVIENIKGRWCLHRGGLAGACQEITPRYKVGEVVAVGEGLVLVETPTHDDIEDAVGYAADGAHALRSDARGWEPWNWKVYALPSIFMPLWAARRWLRITDVRAERALDISEEDGLAEGLVHDESRVIGTTRLGAPMRSNWQASDGEWYSDRVVAWVMTLRDHNSKMKPGDHPWLWAYTFEQVDKPKGEGDGNDDG